MTVSFKIEKCKGSDGLKVLCFAAATICKKEELKKEVLCFTYSCSDWVNERTEEMKVSNFGAYPERLITDELKV